MKGLDLKTILIIGLFGALIWSALAPIFSAPTNRLVDEDNNFLAQGFISDMNYLEIIVYDSNEHISGARFNVCDEGEEMVSVSCECHEWGCTLACFECRERELEGKE